MKQVKWGIIGCGDVTELKSGPAFSKASNSTLLAVMRRNAAKAEDYALRHQVRQWSNDASFLINHEEINAIYIATPPKFHLHYALKALEKGKHVYVEKPMVLNTSEAVKLQDAVERNDAKLVVAHYRRYLPMFLKIKSLIDGKRIGEVKSIDLKFCMPEKNDVITIIEEHWREDPGISGGGLFYDIAPHQIDLMYYLFGKPLSYSGHADNENDESIPNKVVEGKIQFDQNIEFNGYWNFKRSNGQIDRCTIEGEQGKLSFAFFGNKIEVEINGKYEVISFDHPENIQLPMIKEAVNYFLGKVKNPCSVEEGLVVSKIMDCFSKSIICF